MAYSFRDYYRPLRLLLRIDGTLAVTGGPLLLIFPRGVPNFSGEATLWPLQMVGALLTTLGLLLLAAASKRQIERSLLLALMVGSTLAALVLLLAYLRGSLGSESSGQQVLLVLLFGLLLISAVAPLRYMRVDYRT